MIGIDGQRPHPQRPGLRARDGVTFPVGVDADYSVTQGLFAFTGLPESVMVRGDGTIAHITYGALTAAQFARTWEDNAGGATPT